jgi:ferredoxin-NADP reductase
MQTKLITKKEIALDTFEFVLEKPDNFNFRAGQHAEIKILNPKYNDEKGNSRFFSFVSSPDEKNLCFAFRVGPSAFKKNLFELEIGSQLEINGPYGSMLLPKNENNSLVFLAGGIGIAPFISMIRYTINNNLKNEIYLFYFNHSKEKTAYFDELNNYSAQNKIKVFFIMTEENQTQTIHKEIILENLTNDIIKNSIFYIAGPPLFNKNIFENLVEINIPEEKIKFEDFAGY